MIRRVKSFVMKIHYRNYFLVFIIYAAVAHIIMYTNFTDKLDENFVLGLMFLSSIIINIISFLTIFFKGKKIANSSTGLLIIIIGLIFITLEWQRRFILQFFLI